MTKEELEKATGQELIEQRDYCGVDGYYGDYLDNVNAEMLKRFNRLAELEARIEKMKCCGNCQKLRGRFDSKTNINILYCSDSDMKQIEVGFQMCCCKWEIKEK